MRYQNHQVSQYFSFFAQKWISFIPCCLVPKCELKFKKIDQDPVNYKYGPQSVALGDFNNDTWLDMVVVNNAVDSITVYFGYSNVTFRRQREYSTGTGSSPYMISVNDLNGDQRVDIVVANFRTHNVGIFYGFGNGSFSNQTELSTGVSRPIFLTIADVDNDTRLDILTANDGTDSISIFYGYGNGSFSSARTHSTGYDSHPVSLIPGDFNNDNRVDIAVANYGTDNIGILFGNQNETFRDQVVFSTGVGSHPCSIAAAHLNNDSFLDIAVANCGANGIGVLLNNANGTFANQKNYSTGDASP
jgi:hypothetical protein